jgi:acetyltransferase-like isoleucine patch superfamily enzyme
MTKLRGLFAPVSPYQAVILKHAPVHIYSKARLGEGCRTPKGVTVGEDAIIAARSVVLTDIPRNCIAIGNPARVVGFAVSGDTAATAAAASAHKTIGE